MQRDRGHRADAGEVCSRDTKFGANHDLHHAA
jgi:hypothetical protein